MKKWVFLCCALFFLMPCAARAATIDEYEVTSFLQDGVTMAPAYQIAEAMELTFTAEGKDYLLLSSGEAAKALRFEEGRETLAIMCEYGKDKAGKRVLEDEEEAVLEAPWRFINGTLYVPFRFVLEFFGARVSWTADAGAMAQRTDFGHPVLMRTDGHVRERVSVPEGFESALIAGDKLIYLVGDTFYIRPLEGGEARTLCKAGRTHLAGEHLFISSGGRVSCVNLETLQETVLFTGAVMVGYTVDDFAWCENAAGEAFVFDADGNCLAHVTGAFDEAFEYKDGFVYYLSEDLSLHRARADGSEEEYLAKSAAYPALIEGGVYYTDLAGNFRRVDAESKEDILVYGLNLECIHVMDDVYIFNFYAPNAQQCRMFAADFDGRGFRAFASPGVILDVGAKAFREGLCGRSVIDGKLYYVTEGEAAALSEDFASVFCGVYEDFAYYVLS